MQQQQAGKWLLCTLLETTLAVAFAEPVCDVVVCMHMKRSTSGHCTLPYLQSMLATDAHKRFNIAPAAEYTAALCSPELRCRTAATAFRLRQLSARRRCSWQHRPSGPSAWW